MKLYGELQLFFQEMKKYRNLFNTQDAEFTKKRIELRESLIRKSGRLCKDVVELTGKELWEQFGRTYNMWAEAFNEGYLPRQFIALDYCIDAVNEAIGKLETDIELGRRDKQGNLIEEPSRNDTEPPKAFIAHGGKSEACDKLCRFLDALGVTPLIIEEQPTEGRSVNGQVDHYLEQANCAVVVGTADDKELKDGKLYPRRNVYIEIGKFQGKFPNGIIYLLEDGASLPSNISEKLYTRFTQDSMDEAFIAVARELKAFGILKAAKPESKE